MAIFNLGSINIDHVYRVPHLPVAGETLASLSMHSGLGGKGANQSIAIAKAGGAVHHIGVIGFDGEWTRQALTDYGVDTTHVLSQNISTGHAIINVDDAGENAIVLFAGANHEVTEKQLNAALAGAKAGDWLLMQNETNIGHVAALAARANGMKVAYAAAPFDAFVTVEILPFVDFLAVNAIEAKQLADALDCTPDDIPVPQMVITHGAEGAVFRHGHHKETVTAFPVKPVDTTGAGDTFLGYFLAALDAGWAERDALVQAAAASAIQVTRAGAATAIPTATEVLAFLKETR